MGSTTENQFKTVTNSKFTLVGIDIDTTGRRLIDEIVQLCAYHPSKEPFAQYIMPYMNLNPAARQRHQIRVITIGFYRMLKCMQSYKVLKSKSEVSSLRDFLDWIEDLLQSDTGSTGIILIYHEERKFTPYMLLEAFQKYGLLDRFLKTVKSFTNGYDLAKATCNNSIKLYSLRQLSKVLLNKNEINGVVAVKEDSALQNTKKTDSNSNKQSMDQQQEFFEGNASVRAKLSFEIIEYLATHSPVNKNRRDDTVSRGAAGAKISDRSEVNRKMINLISRFALPTFVDLHELEIQNQNLERQNSFRPVFLQYFKTTLYHRVRAVKFRIILAENGHDVEALRIIWNEKRKEGLNEVIQALPGLKSDEKEELIDLLDAYYDPTKHALKPIIKKTKKRTRRAKNKENMKPIESKTNNQGAGDEKSSSLTDSNIKTIKRNSKTRGKNKPKVTFSGKISVVN